MNILAFVYACMNLYGAYMHKSVCLCSHAAVCGYVGICARNVSVCVHVDVCIRIHASCIKD